MFFYSTKDLAQETKESIPKRKERKKRKKIEEIRPNPKGISLNKKRVNSSNSSDFWKKKISSN